MLLMKAKFSIHHINVIFQRNSEGDPDKDLVNFQVATTHNFAADDFTADAPLDVRYEVLGVPIGTPSSGAQVGPPLDPPIESGELFFTDADDIVITCRISNGSHTNDALHSANALKIGGCVAAVIGGGIELEKKLGLLKLSKSAEILAVDGAILGLIVALAGEFLSDYGVALGLVDPDCDGPVFDSMTSPNIIQIPGSLIANGISKGAIRLNQPFLLDPHKDDTQVSQAHCGHNPATIITPAVTVTSAAPLVPIFGELPGLAKKFKARVGHRPEVWQNTWGDHDTIEGSRILCTVSKSSLADLATGIFGDVVRAKLALVPNVADLIGSLPQGLGQARTELPPSAVAPAEGVAAGNTAVAVLTEHILAVSVRENAVGPAAGKELANATSNTAFTIPMNTTEFTENVSPLDTSGISFLKHLHFGDDTAVSHVPPTGDTAVLPLDTSGISFLKHLHFGGDTAASHVPATGGTAVSHVPSGLQFADSIVLDGGITLQLYDAYDESNRFVGPRLRYRRIGSDGQFTDTDVMLQPAQSVPR
jgi:hypothetical protein